MTSIQKVDTEGDVVPSGHPSEIVAESRQVYFYVFVVEGCTIDTIIVCKSPKLPTSNSCRSVLIELYD
jgi:hypothetical protein